MRKRKYNETRANMASWLCDHYRQDRCGAYQDEPDTAVLRDILSDLMHLAAREKDDFEKALTTARVNYEAEIG